MNANRSAPVRVRSVRIPAGKVLLEGELAWPEGAVGLVLFAHGSGSSRKSPRNQSVARDLRKTGLATLLFDLLTPAEDAIDRETSHLRFDIGMLSQRLIAATIWAAREKPDLPIGYFGASTGAAAALVAAAGFGDTLKAVVSRGGRPDLAGAALPHVRAATLLLVGSRDPQVLELNRSAVEVLRCPKQLILVPGATHLFEEPGTLEEVARLAAAWFLRHFTKTADPEPRPEPVKVSVRGE
jgi:putative phosphoribosyl transferase